jgi:hypothetical protein
MLLRQSRLAQHQKCRASIRTLSNTRVTTLPCLNRECIMADILLYTAGGLTLLIAVAHGYIGATRVVAPSKAPTPEAKRILHAIMFLSAVYWFIGGAVLIAAPHLFEGDVRKWVVYVVAAMLLSGALGNMWGTKGRHFGGYFLLLVTGMAVAGA